MVDVEVRTRQNKRNIFFLHLAWEFDIIKSLFLTKLDQFFPLGSVSIKQEFNLIFTMFLHVFRHLDNLAEVIYQANGTGIDYLKSFIIQQIRII